MILTILCLSGSYCGWWISSQCEVLVGSYQSADGRFVGQKQLTDYTRCFQKNNSQHLKIGRLNIF